MACDYECFKEEVYKLTRIDLNAYKEKQMKRRIDTLIERNKCNGYDSFLAALENDKEILDSFVDYLTINVSEFYRNPEQWKILENEIIPELQKKFGNMLNVWSAACSTGDEPYSLVMALSRYMPLSDIKINATDIDKQVIDVAKEGVYPVKSIVDVPQEYKVKYFSKVNDTTVSISKDVKDRVLFKEQNLLKDVYPNKQHLIVCRNVLIYFTEETKQEIFKKFYDSLAPGGILFLGATEQMLNYKQIGFIRRRAFFFEKPK